MKKLLLLFLALFFLGGGIWFFWPFFRLEEIKVAPLKIIQIAEKEIFTPPPLRVPEKSADPQIILNQEEVIKWTNIQREEYGLPAFEENDRLNVMARAKVDDMFQYQYFAHRSPSGEGAEDLAVDFNYEFLAIGENLAMGNFTSNKDLVEAWMASPGHRENILNPTYQEIGVAVGKGMFEGKSVWLAVQHFGFPLAACPQPSKEVKLQIEQKQQELEDLEEMLLGLQIELRKIRPRWSSYYQERAEEYNNLVEKYNNLLLGNKTLINQYNSQVQEFNQCLSGLKNAKNY